MDLRLQFLESFRATGSDGNSYKVRAYERMTRELSIADGGDHWASTGLSEFRLDDGRAVAVGGDGTLRIAGTEVLLRTEAARA